MMRLTSVGVVLGQHRRRLTGIKTAMGCNAGPTLNQNRGVDLYRVYEVHHKDVYAAAWDHD